MADVLERVQSAFTGALPPGEMFVAAARVELTDRPGVAARNPTIAGAPPPRVMIWAVTPRTIYVFSADKLRGTTPKDLLVAAEIGSVAEVDLVADAGARGVVVSMFFDDDPVTVLAARDDAVALTRVIHEASRLASGVPGVPATPIDPTFGDPVVAAARAALEAGDGRGVAAAYAQCATPQQRELLCLALDVTPAGDRALDDWVTAMASHGAPLVVRGFYRIALAWAVRGSGWGDTVGAEAGARFIEMLEAAEDDLVAGAASDAADPVAFVGLLTTGRGLGVGLVELRRRYGEMRTRGGHMPQADLLMLQALCEKWGGSHDEMFAFARWVSSNAPDGSPCHAVVPMAHFERWIMVESEAQREYFPRDEVRAEIRAAAERCVLHPAFIDDPVSVTATNVFAAGLAKVGDRAVAGRLVRSLGARRTELPWGYYGRPQTAFAELQSGI